MLYLSWSAIHLITVIFGVVSIGLIAKYKFKVNNKPVIYGWAVAFVVMLYNAVDVGTRQEDLNRSKFNAVIDNDAKTKVESSRPDAKDAEVKFENTIKEMK